MHELRKQISHEKEIEMLIDEHMLMEQVQSRPTQWIWHQHQQQTKYYNEHSTNMDLNYKH